MYDEMTIADLIVTAHQEAHPEDQPSTEHAPLIDELVRRLQRLDVWRRKVSAAINPYLTDDDGSDLLPELERIENMLERLSPVKAAPVPVPVSERLPEPNTKVLAHYFNDLGKGRTICAIWVPAKTRSDSYGDGDFTEYDEETDNFYWPEGWYEAIENWEDLGWVKVDEGEVVYWQPLPKWPALAAAPPALPPSYIASFPQDFTHWLPATALPLPAVEVQP